MDRWASARGGRHMLPAEEESKRQAAAGGDSQVRNPAAGQGLSLLRKAWCLRIKACSVVPSFALKRIKGGNVVPSFASKGPVTVACVPFLAGAVHFSTCSSGLSGGQVCCQNVFECMCSSVEGHEHSFCVMLGHPEGCVCANAFLM
eukprot:1156263-Pelagomonas_calceolata.AAC.5